MKFCVGVIAQNILSKTQRKLLTQFSTRIYWNRGLTVSDLFSMFTQSINFIDTYYGTEMSEKCDWSKRQKWLVASFSKVYGQMGFVLRQENAFS